MKKLSHKIINANTMEYEKKRPDASGIARGTACPAGGHHTANGSGHYMANVGESVSGKQQGGWRWCEPCMGMFYASSSMNHMGVCPAGGHHTANGSGHYAAIIGESVSGKQQGGWRWCNQCEGMFYASSSMNHMGRCPAGGHHTANGSGHYAFLF